MLLGVKETAVMLGKSERQVRYMLSHELIPGRKKGKSWIIKRTDLTASFPELQDEVESKLQELREATESALNHVAATAKRREFKSIRDLRVFNLAAALYREVRLLANGEDEVATITRLRDALREALKNLAAGCHEFSKEARLKTFRAARVLLSEAAMELYLLSFDHADGKLIPLLDRLERELIPGVGALLRSLDKSS